MTEINVTLNTADWAQAIKPCYRYVFIRGGRSSGKSHEVANYLVERSITEKDLKIVGLREIQKSIDKSSKSLVDDKIDKIGLRQFYSSVQSEIRRKNDNGLFYFQGMNDLTADSIKSLEGFSVAWFEEAQNITHNTIKILRPTIMRLDGAQIIFTWNPKFPDDAIEEFCNQMRNEPDCLVIHVNYEKNPFLSESARREIALDRQKNPEDFDHVWLGDYDTSFHGHYYAKLLDDAAQEGRICEVPRKAGVDVVTAWDLGRSDSTCIWVGQIVGREPRLIDYREGHFEDLDAYAEWIKQHGYNGRHFLPHDGAHERLGMKGSIKSQLHGMGLTNIQVLPPMGKEAGRKLAKTLIKEAYFDQSRCRDGIQALRHDRSERDPRTGGWKELHEIDGAAAFRYFAQALEKSGGGVARKILNDPYRDMDGRVGWMG